MSYPHPIPRVASALVLVLLLAACSEPTGETPSAEEDSAAATPPTADAPPAADADTPPTAPEEPAAAETADSELADTSWEMVEIQSMDDNAWAPEDPSRYTLVFEADGAAYMQLDCNRGRGSWTSEGPGQLTFGPVASTNALCQDDGLSERYARQFEWVRSYVMRDGHLFLATMADGAIIEFRPAQ